MSAPQSLATLLLRARTLAEVSLVNATRVIQERVPHAWISMNAQLRP